VFVFFFYFPVLCYLAQQNIRTNCYRANQIDW